MSVAIALPDSPPAPGTLCFYYGDERICVERSHRQSKVDRVLIKVQPDCRVLVQAPVHASDEDVLQAVKKRARWIYQQLREFRAQLEHVTPRRYISGESHYYLGKQYQLKVIASPEHKQGVKLLRGSLEVSVREQNPDKVQTLLNDWYRHKARDVFARRLDVMLDQALWVTGRPPIRILTMQTQWGSCSPQGRLTLNPHLVKAPRECVDYVILHELCHIAEHNHSERFYRLLKQVMPHYEAVKTRLDAMVGKILT